MRKPRRILSSWYRILNFLTFGLAGWVWFYGQFIVSLILAVWVAFNGPMIKASIGVDPVYWLNLLGNWLNVMLPQVLDTCTLWANWLFGWKLALPSKQLAFVAVIANLSLYFSALFPAQFVVGTVVFLSVWLGLFIANNTVGRLGVIRRLRIKWRTLAYAEARDELVELCPPNVDPAVFVAESLARFAKG